MNFIGGVSKFTCEISGEGAIFEPKSSGTELEHCGIRYRVNMAHISQSRPDSGRVLQAKALRTVQVVPSSLDSVLGAGAWCFV